mgnify:CR=1 FL=1
MKDFLSWQQMSPVWYRRVVIKPHAKEAHVKGRVSILGGMYMSEYADITIRKLSLWWFRNYLNNDIVSLFFSEGDLFITAEHMHDLEDDEFGEYTRYMYKTTVKRAKERFDALGYGISNLEKVFDENILQAIDYSEFLHHLNVAYDDYEEVAQDRIKKRVSFKKWKNAMKKIITYELQHGNIRWTEKMPCISTECEKVIFYSLNDSDVESFYALFPEVIPEPYVFRLILESCADDDEIILDFSNLENWAEDCISKALSAAGNIEKTIVLVEGTSDKEILEYSLKMLYPHLSDLFYFMDFGDDYGAKREGGTSYVIKNLKTFYFSKLNTKFIAIFDNDAEGYQSKCALLTEIKNWPDNFRILLYPENKLFHKYPTLAPNGKIIMDNINKKACSIELYLPDSIIKEDGKFSPIEWEARKKIRNIDGNEEALYQGVITQKDDIKKKFHKLRKAIDKGEKEFVDEEWLRMKQLLDAIVFAFAK